MSENELHECQVFQFGHAREESAKSLHKTKCLSIKIAQRLSAISSQASHTEQQLCGNQVASNEEAGQSKYCTLIQIASVFGCQLAPVVFVAEGALFLGSSNSSGKGKLCNLKRWKIKNHQTINNQHLQSTNTANKQHFNIFHVVVPFSLQLCQSLPGKDWQYTAWGHQRQTTDITLRVTLCLPLNLVNTSFWFFFLLFFILSDKLHSSAWCFLEWITDAKKTTTATKPHTSKILVVCQTQLVPQFGLKVQSTKFVLDQTKHLHSPPPPHPTPPPSLPFTILIIFQSWCPYHVGFVQWMYKYRASHHWSKSHRHIGQILSPQESSRHGCLVGFLLLFEVLHQLVDIHAFLLPVFLAT